MSGALKIAKNNEFRYIQLGLNIAYYRKIAGLTQEELAEQSGLCRTYISSIEAPNMIKTVSLEALFRIADTLKVDVSKLLEFRL